MRTALAALAFLPVLTFAQAQDKTFYFTRPVSAAELSAFTMTVRTVVDLQDVTPDQQHQSLKAHGPLDKLVAADWLLQRLDNPGAADLSAEYKIPGGREEEVLRILPVSPQASTADISALTTAIRTVADLQRLFPLTDQKLLVARATPRKTAAADWIVHQLLPRDGAAPVADSAAMPSPIEYPTHPQKEVIQIFRMDPSTTNAQLMSAVTAIRTVADLQRLFPYESGRAIIANGPPERVAAAEWIVHQLANTPDTNAVYQTSIPGQTDSVVRLFFVPGKTDLTALVTQIRATTGIMRLFPISQPPAVVLRARPDQTSTAEMLVGKFSAGH